MYTGVLETAAAGFLAGPVPFFRFLELKESLPSRRDAPWSCGALQARMISDILKCATIAAAQGIAISGKGTNTSRRHKIAYVGTVRGNYCSQGVAEENDGNVPRAIKAKFARCRRTVTRQVKVEKN